MITKDDVVISHWAIGPSYRRELKETLSKLPLSETWFNTIILTDYPDDFSEFFNKKNVLAVLDLAEQRKRYPWSVNLEKLAPATMDEVAYSQGFNDLRRVNEHFSYSLHRFSLPWIAENGFSKFLMLDADVRFKDSSSDFVQTFLDANYNMPADTKVKLLAGRILDEGCHHRLHDLLASLLEQQFSEMSIPRNFTGVRIPDGPIKIFNFDTPYEVFQYFNVWNLITKHLMGEYRHLLWENYMVGPYAINDEFVIALINKFLNIKESYDGIHGLSVVHNAEKARYFAMTGGDYLPASSLEEFLRINNLTLSDIDK